MAEVQTINSTAGQALVELELELPDARSRSLLSSGNVFASADLSESIYAPSIYKFQIQSEQADFFENQIRNASLRGTPLIRSRIGIGESGNAQWLPWQEHLVAEASAFVLGNGPQYGHMLQLTTTDALGIIDRQSRTTAYTGRISNMVKAIAEQYGLDSVIEETQGDGLYVQCFQSEHEFVRSRLMQRAVNKDGRGHYLLYVKDNTVHFHTPDFQSELKRVLFYSENTDNLLMHDISQAQIAAGIAGMGVIVYDPYSGEAREVKQRSSDALLLGNQQIDFSDISGANRYSPYHGGPNGLQEAQVMANNGFEHARSNSLQLEYTTDRNIFLRPNDFVDFIIAPSNSASSPWSGLYLVSHVHHVVERNALKSRVTMVRGQWQVKRTSFQDLRNQGVTNVIGDDQEPVGKRLNLSELTVSDVTRGAAPISGQAVFLTARDPNTGN